MSTTAKLLDMIRDCGTEYKGYTDEQIFAMLASPNWDDPYVLAWTTYTAFDLQPIWEELTDEGRLVAFISSVDSRERGEWMID